MASRTVSRLTPSRVASSRSGGSDSPGASRPEPDGLQQAADGVLERVAQPHRTQQCLGGGLRIRFDGHGMAVVYSGVT